MAMGAGGCGFAAAAVLLKEGLENREGLYVG